MPFDALRGDRLDLVLLGGLVVGLGSSTRLFAGSAGAAPSLVRFFQVPPGTTYPAALPQDKALLLLTDPRTADAAAGGVAPSGGVGPFLVALGLAVAAAGLYLRFAPGDD